jgi:hypothetical protein
MCTHIDIIYKLVHVEFKRESDFVIWAYILF